MPIKHWKHLGASAYEKAIVRGRQQGIEDNASMHKEMNRYAWILTSFCLAKAKA